MAKSIYHVVDIKTQKVVAEGFASRQEAKVIRNLKNEEVSSKKKDDGKLRFIVGRGLDHPHGPSYGRSK